MYHHAVVAGDTKRIKKIRRTVTRLFLPIETQLFFILFFKGKNKVFRHRFVSNTVDKIQHKKKLED
jgi:hypothetical protein